MTVAKDTDVVLTPMMKQYFDLKAKHPDAIMLFRCGDFYETYSEDAVAAADILGITLNVPTDKAKQWKWQDFHIMHSIHIYPN